MAIRIEADRSAQIGYRSFAGFSIALVGMDDMNTSKTFIRQLEDSRIILFLAIPYGDQAGAKKLSGPIAAHG